MEITMDWLKAALEKTGYIAEQELLITVYLALKLGKPLLIEGAPGVGKTELAKVLSQAFDTELIRLQCYEGLDETKALYEWNYQRQLIRIQLAKEAGSSGDLEKDLFSEDYLLERPLLKAIRADRVPVLLIDEIDKTDEEFEAFLFELLSDFQVSIPEMGTINAKQIPIVVLTSNAQRELSDGLKRRCAYLFVDYPTADKEISIINTKVPGIGDRLAREIAAAVNCIRDLDLKKKPAISETLDWARALIALDADRLNPDLVRFTLSMLLKYKEDLNTFHQHLGPDQLIKCARV